MVIPSVGYWWMWLGFVVLVLVMLAVDMFLLGRQGAHKVSVKEALGWSIVWVSLAMIFHGALWWLLYAVFGAIIMRAVMIFMGGWLITKFHWVLYFFGLFLLLTGVKMFFFVDAKPDLEKNPLLRWMRGHLKITNEYHGGKFFVVKAGIRHATPLFLGLALVEFTDLIFAVDSIPAIFAVTEDPFIVFTSNIFAIMGLRAMYFLLADVAGRFHLLKYGFALVLMFIGLKMLIIELYKIPVVLALGVVVAILATSTILSIATTRNLERGKVS